ncbi:MAG: helicase-associated domain-containing protein, partial [Spirochaetales bacterium]|nr:helicase-associated domain-containing protein [Spirochaetales bacterium]
MTDTIRENRPENPCIVQKDCTLLLEVENPFYADARNSLSRFAELVKSPDKIHTYRITPLSIWNACSTGILIDEIIHTLSAFSKFRVPPEVINSIREIASRFGKVKIMEKEKHLVLSFSDSYTAIKLTRNPALSAYIGKQISDVDFLLDRESRGKLKQVCIKEGYPVHDLAGYGAGESLCFSLNKRIKKGGFFSLRNYQGDAASAFYMGGTVHG